MVHNVRAVFEVLRVVRVEGPQDGPLGAVAGFGVVDRVDQQTESEDVGEQDEFLSGVGADLAGGSEKVDAGHPFRGGKAGFQGEGVEVGDEPFEDVFHAGVGVLRVDQVDV